MLLAGTAASNQGPGIVGPIIAVVVVVVLAIVFIWMSWGYNSGPGRDPWR